MKSRIDIIGQNGNDGLVYGYEDEAPSALAVQIGGDHYKKLAIQPVEYCQRNRLNFLESSVIKYVTRHRDKGKVQDIDKAIHFLQLLKEMEYPE